jgi:hypothetical protein
VYGAGGGGTPNVTSGPGGGGGGSVVERTDTTLLAAAGGGGGGGGQNRGGGGGYAEASVAVTGGTETLNVWVGSGGSPGNSGSGAGGNGGAVSGGNGSTGFGAGGNSTYGGAGGGSDSAGSGGGDSTYGGGGGGGAGSAGGGDTVYGGGGGGGYNFGSGGTSTNGNNGGNASSGGGVGGGGGGFGDSTQIGSNASGSSGGAAANGGPGNGGNSNAAGSNGKVVITPAASGGGSTVCTDPTSTAGEILYNSSSSVMQFCNGEQWVAMGPIGGGGGGLPSGCPDIGDGCDDGSFCVGDHPTESGIKIYSADADQGNVAWGPFGVNTGAEDYLNGQLNQEWIVANTTLSNHPAFELCENLDRHSHQDWYLPAIAELDLIYSNLLLAPPGDDPDNPTDPYTGGGGGTNPPALDGPQVGTFTTSSDYWSSTDYESDSNSAWRQYFSDGEETLNSKNNTYRVRCVRRGSEAAGCANPNGAAGELLYNSSHNVMQYCNGTDWVGIGK